MTVDGWTSAVRRQLGPGRLLPLGGPRDGAWITEAAAGAVLRRAVRHMEGVRLGALRLATADPAEGEPVVPPPPGAQPSGPVGVAADIAVYASEPFPATASRLRAALAAAAAERLGLVVADIDLRVTALLDDEREPEAPQPGPEPPPVGAAQHGDEARATVAALSVTGVTRLTDVVGRAVRLEEREHAAALPHRHARVEIAVGAQHRALDVARRVRAAVSEALRDHPTVTVLVTAVE
ncbi:nucleopolyhedrovirus P10 family protein [Streptomyces hilarionis]|uniref:nucleopolyhedrovirus P10 family protein n=1 Tax=Streptomyces hilarionis TaxID=2839954 RepID=UPI002119ED7F|nr:nucleopolyhedrovirus P10 family protein [Streptomyces hilarionis]MCQ9133540.1 nucleopolyhedrovirus P10 family protein [Streptomyces hilarionis]